MNQVCPLQITWAILYNCLGVANGSSKISCRIPQILPYKILWQCYLRVMTFVERLRKSRTWGKVTSLAVSISLELTICHPLYLTSDLTAWKSCLYWFCVNSFLNLYADCCQGKCQEGEGAESSEAAAQAGPSGESTGSPANDDMEDSAPETSNEETSEMVSATGQ